MRHRFENPRSLIEDELIGMGDTDLEDWVATATDRIVATLIRHGWMEDDR